MSDPNTLVIMGLSDTGTVTDTLFYAFSQQRAQRETRPIDPNPKEKLFPLVNNVPLEFHPYKRNEIDEIDEMNQIA